MVRTVRIAKGGNSFCHPEYIDREMKKLFAALAKYKYVKSSSAEKFAAEVTHFLEEIAANEFPQGTNRRQGNANPKEGALLYRSGGGLIRPVLGIALQDLVCRSAQPPLRPIRPSRPSLCIRQHTSISS